MIKKLLQLYNFILTLVITISAFMQITSPTDAIFPILVLPLNLYFLRLLFDFQLNKNPDVSLQNEAITPAEPKKLRRLRVDSNLDTDDNAWEPQVLTQNQVRDIDRRLFLKLIGSAGLTTFLFSIFTNRTHAAFFGSMPGPGTVALKDSSGNQIDPAEKHPTDGYSITEIDDSPPAPYYYGFVNKTGAWYIQREDSSGSYRYTKGTSSFSTNWTNRASLTYDYFDNIF